MEGWTDSELALLMRPDGLAPSGCLTVLPSSLVEGGVHGLTPMAGRLEVDGDAVCFFPRFPFLAATSYSLVVALGDVEVWPILRPARPGPATSQVVGIFPSAGAVPLNLLKVYISFSAPMSEGEAAGAVHVRRVDTGEVLRGVFLPMDPELWDPERRRLTMLLDPGRIKRGLAPHLEAGYPLIEGVPIVVVIDRGFRDAEGRPLAAGAERRYRVGAAVRTLIDPSVWECDQPMAGTTDPLTLRFDRPLDRALLGHSLQVARAASGPISGSPALGPDEQSWQFVPRRAWQPGRHVVTIASRLEDLAGNSLARVFDRDLTRPEDDSREMSPGTLEFDCVLPSHRPTGPP
ncbi:MAG TPA: hypothetical protein VGH66_11700 [Acidimicrobiales bacterium]